MGGKHWKEKTETYHLYYKVCIFFCMFLFHLLNCVFDITPQSTPNRGVGTSLIFNNKKKVLVIVPDDKRTEQQQKTAKTFFFEIIFFMRQKLIKKFTFIAETHKNGR